MNGKVSLLVCDCVESDISLHIPVLSTQGSRNQQECLVHPNNHTMYGCFGSASGYENNVLDNGGQRHGRSRSPPNRANTGGVSAAAPWTSGNPKLDELFYKKVQDPEILRQFSEIEVYKRKNIMLNMEEKNRRPDSMDCPLCQESPNECQRTGDNGPDWSEVRSCTWKQVWSTKSTIGLWRKQQAWHG